MLRGTAPLGSMTCGITNDDVLEGNKHEVCICTKIVYCVPSKDCLVLQ